MERVDSEFKDKLTDDSKIKARHRFRNGSWEVTLLFDQTGRTSPRIRPDSTIKNVDGGHQPLDLTTPGIAAAPRACGSVCGKIRVRSPRPRPGTVPS